MYRIKISIMTTYDRVQLNHFFPRAIFTLCCGDTPVRTPVPASITPTRMANSNQIVVVIEKYYLELMRNNMYCFHILMSPCFKVFSQIHFQKQCILDDITAT